MKCCHEFNIEQLFIVLADIIKILFQYYLLDDIENLFLHLKGTDLWEHFTQKYTLKTSVYIKNKYFPMPQHNH